MSWRRHLPPAAMRARAAARLCRLWILAALPLLARGVADESGLRSCVVAPHAVGEAACADRPSDVGHPLPRFVGDSDRSGARCPADCASCTDATPFARVLDLSCEAHARGAAYHRVRDCLVPNFDVVDAALGSRSRNDTVLLVPPYLADFVDFLLPRTAGTVPLVPLPAQDMGACVRLAPGALVLHGAGSRAATPKALAARGDRLRALAYERAGVVANVSAAKREPRRVLLIERGATARRDFRDAPALRATLAAGLGRGAVTSTYRGNESVANTVRLFADARVVVGFHGAGFINAAFCRRGAVVAELSFLLNESAAPIDLRPFRSNSVGVRAIAAPGVRWLVHALPAAAAHLPDAAELDAARERIHDRDHTLKQASRIDVPPIDVFNLVSAVNTLLQA